MVNLCITTFNRQDLLPETIRSAFRGSVKPDNVFIVAQDGAHERVLDLVGPHVPSGHRLVVVDPMEKRGCESWAINYYLRIVPEERIIAHDDVIFGERSIEKFIATPGANLADTSLGVITYRDECVRRVGFYDEDISPNFYRYNDVDYMHRCALADIWPVMVDCDVIHVSNGTMRAYTPDQMADYEKRVELAHQNYLKKWGAEPQRDPRTNQWM